ncbi:hypothetical protein HDZ31DRAFT_62309 [Schizophyllum fasciatum]
MAKTPSKSSLRASSRPPRKSAPVHFAEHSEDEMKIDSGSEKSDDDDDNDADDLRNIFEALQKRQKKKASARTIAFQNQKKALYNAGRKNVQDLFREATQLAENIRAQVADLEEQEISYEQQKDHFASLLKAMDQETEAVLGFSTTIEDLNARRVTIIDTCSSLVEGRPAQREKALQTFLIKARDQVERSRAEQKSATDAKALIKQYKTILRAAGNE